jgi:hypothetical protein
MEAIETLRKSVERLVAQKLGMDQHQPRRFTGQTSASDFMRVIMALPVDNSEWTPLQDTLTGELFFSADNSLVDGGDPIQ